MTYFLRSLVFLFFFMNLQAQNTDQKILFTVDKDPVTEAEFLRVYNKNLDLVKDESQKDVDAYLQLFVDYKLKIKEAKRLGLDEKPSYKKEFASYKRQLTENYLSNNKATDDLIKEAYDRSVQDIKASHILIRVDDDLADTTEVYEKLLKLRERILSDGYATVQKEVHNGQTVYAEDLGYFSIFKMVYPFETMAYKTNIGDVSMPFKTQFGYHIVYVQDKRPSLGQVTVAHIMVSNNQKDKSLVPEVRIKEIYKKLQQGESFEVLAKQFSDDKSSSSRGGALSPFTGGQLSSQEFEDVAFSLEKVNSISNPFKTDFGWHIVKLLDKKGIPTFEEARPELEAKIKRDSRSKLIDNVLLDSLRTLYTIKVSDESVPVFEELIDDSYFKGNWKVDKELDSSKVILSIQKETYSYPEFLASLRSAQRKYINKNMLAQKVVETELKAFVDKSLLNYHRDHLEFENPEFGFVVNEYREGLLLFDLMEQEVWNAASKDSIGLKNFYEQHKSDYQWKQRFAGSMLTSASKEVLDKAEKLLKKSKSIDEISDQLNTEEKQNIIVTNLELEKGDPSLPENFKFEKGISKIYEHQGSFHLYQVDEIKSAGLKTLDEARGRVVGDYQNHIEKEWLDELHKRYKVTINDDILQEVKSKIKAR